jgi:hypothetical protein
LLPVQHLSPIEAYVFLPSFESEFQHVEQEGHTQYLLALQNFGQTVPSQYMMVIFSSPVVAYIQAETVAQKASIDC